jgi:hypothetical protein
MVMEVPYSASRVAASSPQPSSFDTSPSQAWADAMARAKIDSKQPEVPVSPGDTLTSIAGSHQDPLSSVEAINPDLYNPAFGFNRIFSGQTVDLPKKTPAEVVSGVNNSQIKPIITAMANANAHPHQTAAWTTVQHDTYTMLLTNTSDSTPDQTAVAQVRHLDALEPGNTNFVNANDAALKEWQQLNFGPIIAAYNGGRGQLTSLANAIRTSLNNAADQAGSDPKARGDAIATRAALLEMVGPPTAAFRTAVRDAVGFAQPTDESATTLPGRSHPGNDPFNIIISGNSNVTVKQFLAGLEAVPDPAGQPLHVPVQGEYARWAEVPASNSLTNPGVGPEYANVQPPGQGHSVVQPYSMRIGGKFSELGSGINHFRLYEQQTLPGNNQGAYFITASRENFDLDVADPPQSYHDVATNGYNQGRDDLLADIRTAAKEQGWTVQVAEYPTAPGTGSNGISYDGNIYVVTLTHEKSGPAIS